MEAPKARPSPTSQPSSLHNTMTIQQILQSEEVQKYQQEHPQAVINIYTFATANQTEASFHTDRCRCIYSEYAGFMGTEEEEEEEWEIMKIDHLDEEELNNTIYANQSAYAEEEEEIAIFVK